MPLKPGQAGGDEHAADSASIETQNPLRTRRIYTSKGIAIESRVDWPQGGASLYFRDPDRLLVELATPGIWGNA